MTTVYEWDPIKDRTNIRDHHISFETAQFVFDDPDVLTYPDRFKDGEERLQAIGTVGGIVVLAVCHTIRHEDESDLVIRIISARKATPTERRRYERRKYAH
jgi:uncharacterized DUF497 family protein